MLAPKGCHCSQVVFELALLSITCEARWHLGKIVQLVRKAKLSGEDWSPTVDGPGIVQYTHVLPLNFCSYEAVVVHRIRLGAPYPARSDKG